MNYPTLAGLTLDGRIYRNEEMGTVESMVPPGPFATCHSPAMLELPNGDMLCCWFAGTYEGEADVHIVCARLPKRRQLLPSAYSDPEKWPLDFWQLAVHRL